MQTAEPQYRVPSELQTAYRGERYIARAPFLVNPIVDDSKAMETLGRLSVAPDDVFTGIAGLRALDLLANIGKDGERYRHAVLVDQNTTQAKAMNGVLHMIEHSPDADAFIKTFAKDHAAWVNKVPRVEKKHLKREWDQKKDRREEEDWNYFAVHGNTVNPRTEAEVTEILKKAQQDPNSWLHEDNYQFIRQMAQDNHIQTAIVDLTDPERTSRLNRWIKEEQGLRVGDVYVSSLEGFNQNMHAFDYYGKAQGEGDRKAFFTNLQTLMDNGGDGTAARLLHSKRVQNGHQKFVLTVDGPELVTEHLNHKLYKPTPDASINYEKPLAVGHRQMMLTSSSSYYEDLGDLLRITISADGPADRSSPGGIRPFTDDEQTVIRKAFSRAGFPVMSWSPSDDCVSIGYSAQAAELGDIRKRVDDMATQIARGMKELQQRSGLIR